MLICSVTYLTSEGRICSNDPICVRGTLILPPLLKCLFYISNKLEHHSGEISGKIFLCFKHFPQLINKMYIWILEKNVTSMTYFSSIINTPQIDMKCCSCVVLSRCVLYLRFRFMKYLVVMAKLLFHQTGSNKVLYCVLVQK